MKLIIDIDEKRINAIKLKAQEQDIKTPYPTLEQIIANGIPLDKLRAEIDDLDRHYDNDYFSGNKDSMFKCNEVLQIIDKYRNEVSE